MRFFPFHAIWITFCLSSIGLAQETKKFPGLGDPGTLQSIRVETGRGPAVKLAGRDAGQQLIITGEYSSQQIRDLSRKVQYQANPNDLVVIDETGYVIAAKEGTGTIRVEGPQGKSASIAVVVTDFLKDVPIHFANEVVPIFTRFGCNSGGCHGKSGGQNGFGLSLLGFEPGEDFEYLVKEARGRRIFPASPEQSLLLLKATGRIAHGGGGKIKGDSSHYRVLKRWIEQGTPQGRPEDAVVTKIEVFPRERLLDLEGDQQITVVAHYSNGATQDVTRLAQFESNDMDVASVSETGLAASKKVPGSAAVMTRFLTHVDAFRVTIPLGVAIQQLPAGKNFIDHLVFKQLKKLGLPPSGVCDDATFIRRATIDIAGRLPTVEEVKGFQSETSEDKREKLVDRLIASPDYADYFANKWSAVLRNKRSSPKEDAKPTFAFHTWIRDKLHNNKPFDEIVKGVLTATGPEVANPPVAWYREVKDIPSQVEDVAQLLLGTRIQCARCHHHPLEKWSQEDYYGLAAFFSQVNYKVPPKVEVKKGEKKGPAIPKITDIEHKIGLAKAQNPRTKKDILPTVLGGKSLEIPKEIDPRIQLAEWITGKENPYFARTLVNRYWKHFFARGLVDPEDDLRMTNPPTNPELLDALAKSFVDSNYDLKKLVRTMSVSHVYQLSSDANDYNYNDKQNYSRFQSRRLHAEVMFDAIDQVTLAKPGFNGMPAGTRAVQLPDNAFESYFLTLFGRPDASSACECERSGEVNLSQMLHLMNSYEIMAKVSGKTNLTTTAKSAPTPKGKQPQATQKLIPGERLSKLIADQRPHPEKISELYILAYSRNPNPQELQLLVNHLTRNADIRQGYEDVIWVLINSEEFLFNH